MDADTPAVTRRNPYPESLGLTRFDGGVGFGKFAFDPRPHDMNGVGAVHGGVIAGLLDLVCAMGAGAHPDPKQRQFSITLSLNINFVGAARPERLICTGRRIGGGRRNVFVEGRIEHEDGFLVATAQGAFKLMAPGA